LEHVKTIRCKGKLEVRIACQELLLTSAGCKALAELWLEMEKSFSDGTLRPMALEYLERLLDREKPRASAPVEDREDEIWRLVSIMHGWTSGQAITSERAKVMLMEFAREQAASLRQNAQHIWEERDRIDFEKAHERAAIDTSPEGARLKRYLAEN